jgi:hypothetical protein
MALPEDPNEWTPAHHRAATPAQRNVAADQLQEEYPDWRDWVWDLADPAGVAEVEARRASAREVFDVLTGVGPVPAGCRWPHLWGRFRQGWLGYACQAGITVSGRAGERVSEAGEGAPCRMRRPAGVDGAWRCSRTCT